MGPLSKLFVMYNGDTSYPFVLRHDLVGQLAWIEKEVSEI
jgi:hypothetical protein